MDEADRIVMKASMKISEEMKSALMCLRLGLLRRDNDKQGTTEAI